VCCIVVAAVVGQVGQLPLAAASTVAAVSMAVAAAVVHVVHCVSCLVVTLRSTPAAHRNNKQQTYMLSAVLFLLCQQPL
jgi:hypothetical protein